MSALTAAPMRGSCEFQIRSSVDVKIIFLDRNMLLSEYYEMSLFAAIVDPTRRDILALLRNGELSVGALVELLGLPQPNVSKHLAALRLAGLVRMRIAGPRRFYRLDPAPFAEFDEWLAPYREFWSSKLDAPGEHLKNSH